MNLNFLSCILGGALGDAFGAPVEGLNSLEKIKAVYGPHGIQDFASYKSMFDPDEESEGVGAITDDTSMTACTMAAAIIAKEMASDAETFHTILPYQTYQIYLRWGACQKQGELIAPFIDQTLQPLDEVKPFLFHCGAGPNTVAALAQGVMGTIDKPLHYDMTIGERHVVGPNKGCGAIMRGAALAYIDADDDTMFLIAQENAAITHGDPDAQISGAVTSYLIRQCEVTRSIPQALDQTEKQTRHHWTENMTLAWDMARRGHNGSYSEDFMENLPKSLNQKSAFLAIPVFAQIIYALDVAPEPKEDKSAAFKQSLIQAVNHGGDSDSVGAVVGNCLGAAWGMDALPKDWLGKLQYKDELVSLNRRFENTFL